MTVVTNQKLLFFKLYVTFFIFRFVNNRDNDVIISRDFLCAYKYRIACTDGRHHGPSINIANEITGTFLHPCHTDLFQQPQK